MSPIEIIHIWVSDQWQFNFEIGNIVIVIFATITLLLIISFLMKGNFTSEVELTLPMGLGNLKIKATHEVVQIAHQAWTELITRKAGLLFDPEHDVIVEVYNSWYELFRITRNLIKEIPVRKIKDKNTKLLTDTLIKVLNDGMRPHLTKWQARFRRWYEHEMKKEKNTDRAPQDVQREYPHYQDLIRNLTAINKTLVEYTNELKKIFN
ncbi:MAG: hypothetical protein V1936_02500 [Patescibacteria group bacterium]